MEEIKWSVRASKDAADIYHYIALDSRYYADKWIDRVINRLDQLPSQPRMGRIVPEKGDKDLRELIEGNYRIIYRISKGGVIIVYRIIHSARLFK